MNFLSRINIDNISKEDTPLDIVGSNVSLKLFSVNETSIALTLHDRLQDFSIIEVFKTGPLLSQRTTESIESCIEYWCNRTGITNTVKMGELIYDYIQEMPEELQKLIHDN